MSVQYFGFGLRDRPVSLARRRPEPLHERWQRMYGMAQAGLSQPFKGVTSNGDLLPGLFNLEPTGVSNHRIVEAARSLLDSLSEDQQASCRFAIDAQEWREWSNMHGFTTRHGLLLETLDDAGREAALAVVSESLSAAGYQLARDIMRLNETMMEISNRPDELGEWLYFFSLFGEPSADKPWGWQLDGHHLCVNFFILGGQAVMAPVFMGSEPVLAETGKYKGTRVFEAEEAEALEFARSLSPAQQARAFTSDPGDAPPVRDHIVAGAYNDNAIVSPEGIPFGDLDAGQQDLLLKLARTYVYRMRPDLGDLKMQEVKHHLNRTTFLWNGGTDDDSVFYYRLHSPVLLIEFDHQDGIFFDNDARSRNHIHTVVRTPNGNDYGRDLLRQHLLLEHGPSNGEDRPEVRA